MKCFQQMICYYYLQLSLHKFNTACVKKMHSIYIHCLGLHKIQKNEFVDFGKKQLFDIQARIGNGELQQQLRTNNVSRDEEVCQIKTSNVTFLSRDSVTN